MRNQFQINEEFFILLIILLTKYVKGYGEPLQPVIFLNKVMCISSDSWYEYAGSQSKNDSNY